MFEAPILDPVRFTALGEVVEGRVAVVDLERLKGALHTSDGKIHYRVAGMRTPEERCTLSVRLEGRLNLVCQRCLSGVDFDLAVDDQIIMVENEASLPSLDDEADGVDVIVRPEKVSIAELVEEEILLALPLVPCHPEGACNSNNPGLADGGREPPFAALGTLKSGSS